VNLLLQAGGTWRQNALLAASAVYYLKFLCQYLLNKTGEAEEEAQTLSI